MCVLVGGGQGTGLLTSFPPTCNQTAGTKGQLGLDKSLWGQLGAKHQPCTCFFADELS